MDTIGRMVERGSIHTLARPPPKASFSVNSLYSQSFHSKIGLSMREHGEPATPEPRKESAGIEAARPG